jgi:outer membrane protein assembly factor BamD (BamD/ComL family)
MFQCAYVLLIALLLAGCAATTPRTGSGVEIKERSSESKKLSQAIEFLDEGKPVAAARALHAVTLGDPVPGVTDEALFRLAVLSLRGGEKGYANASQQLRRLKREYPGSPWTVQAAPLATLLHDVEELKELNELRELKELKEQNRSLKGSNQALGREVGELKKEINELNSQIKQLKNLDLELEQRGR